MVMAEGATAPSKGGGLTTGEIHQAILRFYPAERAVDESVPGDARRFLQQALDTRFAPDACIVMAAAAVDAMLGAKGYKEGSLYGRIDKAVADHLLTEDMGKWAHRVRLEGNAVRHADERPAPTTKDAEHVLEFAIALGDFMFVLSARVAEGIRQAGGASIDGAD